MSTLKLPNVFLKHISDDNCDILNLAPLEHRYHVFAYQNSIE